MEPSLPTLPCWRCLQRMMLRVVAPPLRLDLLEVSERIQGLRLRVLYAVRSLLPLPLLHQLVMHRPCSYCCAYRSKSCSESCTIRCPRSCRCHECCPWTYANRRMLQPRLECADLFSTKFSIECRLDFFLTHLIRKLNQPTAVHINVLAHSNSASHLWLEGFQCIFGFSLPELHSGPSIGSR